MHACTHAELLLKEKADADQANEEINGMTPLHLAVLSQKTGETKLLQLLIGAPQLMHLHYIYASCMHACIHMHSL